MSRRPGTPRLLRELNDRAALELLLASGPLSRTQLGELTGLSKVTASQLLGRLEERGLVHVVGTQAGGRGPNASLYAVVPSSAYVAGLEVGPDGVTAAIADVTGTPVAEVTVDPNGSGQPVAMVHNAVVRAGRSAKVPLSKLRAFVIGTPGVVDPRSGDVRFSFDLPAWHEGVLDLLRHDLKRPVTIENDVNLAAIAERDAGVADGVADFVMLWMGRGLGMAAMMGGRLLRGATGGAGEIGWLPVPGAGVPEDVSYPPRDPVGLDTGFQALVGARAVGELAGRYGFGSRGAEAVRRAVAAGEDGHAFLDELAGRIAVGVAAIGVILDPGLVVLGGELGPAGGEELARRVQRDAWRICPSKPRVTVSGVPGNPVLTGALIAATEQAREELFDSTA
ncbi:MAG: ROK family protein [Streptosporangiales bacterium]|nr:ROK family protein [Streptosporangiales bacterium]